MIKYKLLAILIITSLLISCSSQSYIFLADKKYNKGQAFASCRLYSKAYDKYGISNQNERAQLAERIADIYSSINDNRNAYLWYRKSLFAKDTVIERCEKALYMAYKLNKKADVERYETKYGIKLDTNLIIESEKRYLVKPFEMANSRYDDYSPAFLGDDSNVLFFTSNRRLAGEKVGKKSVVTGDFYSDVYMTSFTDEIEKRIPTSKNSIVKTKTIFLKEMQWVKPVKINDSLVNSGQDDGLLTSTSDGSKVFFSSSRKYKGINLGTKIYSANRDSKNKMTNLAVLDIVNDSISIGQSAISPEGDKLFFVSRMNGGYGKADIWYSMKTDNKWSAPINAGDKINSDANEMYPSFDSNGNLYISSDGHGSYGGLDIFKVVGDYGNYSLEHLPYPFNSRADDFGIIIANNEDKGFFTSSRGKRADNDIYSFKYDPFSFKVNIEIRDKALNIPIEKVTVKMLDSEGTSIDGLTNQDGKVILDWKFKSEAVFVIHKEGFFKHSFTIDTRDETENKLYDKVFELNRIDAVIVIPNIFYEFAKASLTDESVGSLNDLVNLLNDNPNVVIELASHTDMIGDDTDNMLLSQNRAQTVIDYLIDKGVDSERLVAKGYGESIPKTVSADEAELYSFLSEGQMLSASYVMKLKEEEQLIVNQLNRRTEFRVLRKDFIPKKFRIKN